MFAAKYQLKRVTVVILNCASFQFVSILCCLTNRKGSLNSVSIRIIKCFAVSTVTTRRVQMLSFGIDTALIIVFPLVYCPADDTLFEVGPESRCSRCSDVSSR